MSATIIRAQGAVNPVAGTDAGDAALDNFRRDLLATLGDARLLWLPKSSDTTTNTDDTRHARTITYDATIAGDTTALGSGIAWDLDGTAEEADTPDTTELSFGDGAVDEAFSMVALVNLDQIDATGTVIASKWDSGGGTREYLLQVDATTGNLRLELYDDTANDFIGRLGGTALTATNWGLCVSTYDGSGSVTGIRLYLDGVRIDTSDVGAGGYVAMNNLATPLNIGTRIGASPELFWDGQMAMVAVTAKELNIDEIWQIKSSVNSFFDLSL